jgi:hypothetical protein
VTFEEKGGKTLIVLHDLYPSQEALDNAIASGTKSGTGEQFEQLDELLVTPGTLRYLWKETSIWRISFLA